MNYEIIIFDADETLFDFRKSEEDAFKKSLTDFGIPYNHLHFKLYQTINNGIWKEFEEGSITQADLKIERFRRFANQLHIIFNPAEFAKAYIKHLANASFLFDESAELSEKLQENNKLIIITNGLTDVQDKRIRQSSIAKYFDAIIISEEIGVAKPDPAIFRHALELIGHDDKRSVLMIGDSLTSDIQGGINFGVDTCWYNPQKIANVTSIHPTYEISSLMELIDLVKN